MMNKKAQISETITWYVAFIIIFFLLIIFLGLTGVLVGQRSIPFFGEGSNTIVNELERASHSTTYGNFLNVMNLPVEVNGEKILIKELVEKGNTEDSLNAVQNVLDNNCKNYFLGFPDGFVFKEGDDKKILLGVYPSFSGIDIFKKQGEPFFAELYYPKDGENLLIRYGEVNIC